MTEATTCRERGGRTLSAVLVGLAVQSTAVASLGTPLLPTIERQYQVSLAASQWALTVSLLVGAVATPLLGRLGDGRRRRPATLAATAAMGAGCVVSALPGGLAMFLLGRALQGVGFGVVPLATAVARDNLGPARSRPTISLIGITTAAGIGIGYPVVGALAQLLGLHAPFWLAAGLSAVCLAAAVAAVPPSPDRPAPLDLPGGALLGLGISGLLLALAQGPTWGWGSPATAGFTALGLVLLAVWTVWELRTDHPLIDLRQLRRRPVLAANLTICLVALGFYPLSSLVVRYVQTPAGGGYGFGASIVVAGLMLTPFSAASLAASRIARWARRRISAEALIAASCAAMVGSLALFALARDAYWEIVLAMALNGLGVGVVFALTPLQITGAVPPAETGSAMSFYQLARTVAYAVASALSASLLALTTDGGKRLPADGAYTASALVGAALLVAALVVGGWFALTGTVERRTGPRPAG